MMDNVPTSCASPTPFGSFVDIIPKTLVFVKRYKGNIGKIPNYLGLSQRMGWVLRQDRLETGTPAQPIVPTGGVNVLGNGHAGQEG